MAFSGVFINPFRGPFGDPAAAAVDFADTLVNTYGANEVWKLTNIASGTTITAHVDSARNGTLTGWDLQNLASPVVGDSGLAPFSDGVNDFGNIYSASLGGIYNGGIGSAVMFIKLPSAAYSDGTQRFALRLSSSPTATNLIQLSKGAAANSLRFRYLASNTGGNVDFTTTSTNWMCIGMSWRDAANGGEMKAFVDGVQVGSTVTVTGNTAGALFSSTAAIGSGSGTGALAVHSGHLAWLAVKFGSIWSPTDFANINTGAVS